MMLNYAKEGMRAASASPRSYQVMLRPMSQSRCCKSFERNIAVHGYKFGDLSRRLAKEAQEGLERLGQTVTGDENYHLGDLTKKTLSVIKEKVEGSEIKELSHSILDKLRGYKFGSITQSVLQTEWGQQLLEHTEAAGRQISGRPDYKFGDFSREVASNLANAKDHAAKMLALPNEVERLKHIVVEQQILLNALTKNEATKEEAGRLLQLAGDEAQLKPLILSQQDAIDVLLSEMDEGDYPEGLAR